MARFELAMPTTFSCSWLRALSVSYCWRICSISFPPTVPTPQINRLSTLYSERKNESWMTLSALRRLSLFTTNEILVSLAPCAQAMTLMPLRPKVPKSLPALPGKSFMLAPTMATVAKPRLMCMGNMAPSSISAAKVSLSTCAAFSASSSRTPILVEFSDDACATMNTLIPRLARAVKMRRLTPITPTIERPVTVISAVPLMELIPLIGLWSSLISAFIVVPGLVGLKVFLTLMGMFFTQTG